MNNPSLFLIILFPIGGIIMLIAGIRTISRLHGNPTTYHNTKRPIYRYYYNGQEYVSSPLLCSNRPVYHPEPGYCKIRINPDKPEKEYSSERKFAGAILIIIGISWILVPVLVLFLLSRLSL